ncbi:hypothetical protein QR680_005544 [Steinernema hermaphroditum]|uniref:MH2 domain-containing protein n=1 Tax=Steinernema hermaphroditum TaxID=289476 RepID=A0AA39LVU7_9BILA|nr:hypothetical protein QR680_005544 [Steinernema hermaphroditum]
MANDQESRANGKERKRTQPQIVPSVVDEVVNEKIEPKRNSGTLNKWMLVTYYEYFERVGSFEGYAPLIAIDGFCDSSAPDRFCLGAFGAPLPRCRSEKVVQVRRQIGCGCHIKKDRNQVLIVNRSEASIFVQCPMQTEASGCSPTTVKKLRKGDQLVVFDKDDFVKSMEKNLKNNENRDFYQFENMAKVRISFGKGFGEGFTREKVTDVPCWVEVSFIDIMRDVDKELMQSMAQSANALSSFT